MAGLNATAKNAQLDANAAVWPPDTVSLHNSDPGSGASVAGGTELTGGSPAYARKSVTWAAASSSSKAASALPTFDVAAGSTPSHLGYWRSTTYLGSRALAAAEGAYGAQGTYTPTAITESLTWPVARYGNSITKTTGAAAAPIATLGASSTRDLRVFEVGISVSTAVSGEVGLMRPANTPAGGSGGQVGAANDTAYAAGLAATANAWTTAPTASTAFRRMVLPATIGAGVIWTFPAGLVVPTSGFLTVWQFSALAVTYSVYFDYEE